MEPLPLQPLSQSAPVFQGYGTNPLDVFKGRMAQQAAEAKEAALKQAALDKAKAEKAKANMPEFGQVYTPHTNEYLGMVNSYNQWHAAKMQEAEKLGDRNLDPNEPGSKANLEDLAMQASVKQYAKNSDFLKTRFEAFHNDYVQNPGKYTPDDYAAMVEATNASPYEYMTGKRQLPQLIGYWNKADVIKKVFETIEPSTWENSTYDPELDMFTDTGGGGVTDGTIRQQAFAIATPGTQEYSRWTREVEQLPEEQQKQLAIEADKYKVTPAQVKAYKDMKALAYSTYQEKKSSAGLKSGMYGSGWGNEEASASLFVEQNRGIEEGNIEGQKPVPLSWFSGEHFQKETELQNATLWEGWNNLNYKVKVDEEGKEIPMKIKGVILKGNKRAIAYEDPTESSAIKKTKISKLMDADEFASEVMGKIPDANPKVLQSKAVIRYAEDKYGAVTGKKGTVDLHTNPEKALPFAERVAQQQNKERQKGNRD